MKKYLALPLLLLLAFLPGYGSQPQARFASQFNVSRRAQRNAGTLRSRRAANQPVQDPRSGSRTPGSGNSGQARAHFARGFLGEGNGDDRFRTRHLSEQRQKALDQQLCLA